MVQSQFYTKLKKNRITLHDFARGVVLGAVMKKSLETRKFFVSAVMKTSLETRKFFVSPAILASLEIRKSLLPE